MRNIFHKKNAKKVNLYSLWLIIFLLAATPIRSTVIVALLMLYSIFFLKYNSKQRKELYTEDYLVIIILLSCLLGRIAPFILSGFSIRYLSAGFHIAASIPIFLMLKQLIDNNYLTLLKKYISTSLGVSGVGVGLVALWQTQILGWKAADGFLYSINFGYMSCAIFVLSLAFSTHKEHRYWLIIGCIGALTAVVLSGSRGAIFPLPLLLITWLFLNLKTISKRNILTIILAAPVLIWATYNYVPTIKERTDIGVSEVSSFIQGEFKREGSFSYRVQLWIAAIEALKENPLIGITYPERESLNLTLIEKEKVSPWVGTINRGHAHSQYFETLATGGIIGFIALSIYLFLPLFIYFRYFLKDKNNTSAIAGILLTQAYILCGLTEVLLQQEMIAAFYGFMQVTLILMARQTQSFTHR